MGDALVSIVLPTYKRSHILKATIDSVFRQTYGNWELIVVDDNHPSDPHSRETEKVISDYMDHPNVVLITHGVNKGACAARNTGIAAAKGKFIAFLDDDDTWATDKLALQVDALQKNAEAAFVFCDLICVDSTDNSRKLVNFGLSKDSLFLDLLKRGAGICTSALVIRKDVLVAIGGFDNSLPSYQDYDLLLRLSLCSKGMSIEVPLLTYNVSADGISRNYEAKFAGKKIIIERYEKYFSDRSLAHYYGLHLGVLADYAILHGKRWIAVKYYALSISKTPVAVFTYVKLLVTLLGGEWLYRFTSDKYQKLRQSVGR